ncbi:MAG: hypothetical protein M3171_03390 [Actinomycetota bacterium]|nr:hypothetical protein [Actinomycetota bacterium]
MSTRAIHIDVDLTVDGAVITGRVIVGSSPPRAFSGRLGLLMAIEHAIEQPQAPDSSWTPGVVRHVTPRTVATVDPSRPGLTPSAGWADRDVAS